MDEYDDSDFWDYEPSDYDTVATDDGSQYDAEAGYDSSAYDTVATDDSSQYDPNDTPAGGDANPYGDSYDAGAGYGTDDYPSQGTPGADQFEADQGYLYSDAAGNDFYADGSIGLPDGSYLYPDGSYELSDGSSIAANGDYTDAQGNLWENMGWAGAGNLYQDANGDVWNAATGEITQAVTVNGPYVDPATAQAANTSAQSAPAATAPKATSGGGGGSGGGGSSLKLPTTPTKPTTSSSTGSAPAKTIKSDQRIGNDRYLVYSDGSSQRITDYYKPAAGTATVGTVVNDLLGTAGKIAGAVLAPATNPTAPKLPSIPTSATTITGLVKPPGGANPTVPTGAKPAVAGSSSAGAGLLVVAAIAAKLFIFH